MAPIATSACSCTSDLSGACRVGCSYAPTMNARFLIVICCSCFVVCRGTIACEPRRHQYQRRSYCRHHTSRLSCARTSVLPQPRDLLADTPAPAAPVPCAGRAAAARPRQPALRRSSGNLHSISAPVCPAAADARKLRTDPACSSIWTVEIGRDGMHLRSRHAGRRSAAPPTPPTCPAANALTSSSRSTSLARPAQETVLARRHRRHQRPVADDVRPGRARRTSARTGRTCWPPSKSSHLRSGTCPRPGCRRSRGCRRAAVLMPASQ